MTQKRPVTRRKKLHQFLLHLLRRFPLNKSKPMRQSENMRVHYETFTSTESIVQHDIRRLSSHAGKRNKRFHRVGNLAVKFFKDFSASILNVLCLIVKEPRRADEFL